MKRLAVGFLIGLGAGACVTIIASALVCTAAIAEYERQKEAQ